MATREGNPFRAILDVLRAREDKRLAAGVLYSEELKCPCVMGAFIPEEVRNLTEEKWLVARQTLSCQFEFLSRAFRRYCEARGVTADIATWVQELNDERPNETPEARYKRVCNALEERANEWDNT